ncbi:MAG: superoxide dismutase [Lachnospiraceae bacterium]|nr:superoxide dismutase [Lachnospiraceae bacterium]
MREETYPFVVRPLPYEYDALVPVLDAETLTFHHDKHYKTYVDNLNSALSDYPELQKMSLPQLLTDITALPAAIQTAVRNNGGGVYNHELYFDSMREPVGQEPEGALSEAIERDFGSYRQWKEKMKQAAAGKFGSGWAWLVADKKGALSIVQTSNQDVPDLEEYTPILLVDVWEHAYYLQYQNRRADYLDGWFELINWRKAGKRYEEMRTS